MELADVLDGGAVEHRPLGADTGVLGRSPRRPAAATSIRGCQANARLGPGLGARQAVIGKPSGTTLCAADAEPCGPAGRLRRSRTVRRADADRRWLGRQLDQQPSRLLYVGHATAADGDIGHADRAALHLAEERPVTAADLMSAKLPLPPRIAMIACASGGDYQFDEATGLVAAMILAGRSSSPPRCGPCRPPPDTANSPAADGRPDGERYRRRPRTPRPGCGARSQPMAARADASMARWQRRRQPAVLGRAGHLRRRWCTVILSWAARRLPPPTRRPGR